MELEKILGWLDEVLEIKKFDDVSNNGLQIGRLGTKILRVAFAVDASVKAVKAAAKSGAEMLVVHHGISWGGGIKRITGGQYNVVRAAIDANIAVAGYHLPLDANRKYGNNYGLARFIGMRSLKPAFSYHGNVIGVIGKLDGHIIGVCSGGAGIFAEEAKRLGCDLYITGEADWSEQIAAENAGVYMRCYGHYRTEVMGVRQLSAGMRRCLGLETIDLTNVLAPVEI